ncbi:MAG: TIGR03936 family radical SAM-associated protein, partial [Clostridiales Family XIII bacterium]|nr:TIGR03936 family radical SAM-associated protein [Clostridiales Family XIII bacterium]
QPLPTGMSSVAEYMEFETERADFAVERWKSALNEKLPGGIEVISTRELPDEGKAVAALVTRARYRISMPFFRLYREKSQDYMKRAAIFAEKIQKKTGETRQIDIRPMIRFFETTSMDNEIIVLDTIIDTGSASNLNPETLTRNFCEYCGEEYDRSSVRIERTELFLSQNGEPVSADLFYA